MKELSLRTVLFLEYILSVIREQRLINATRPSIVTLLRVVVNCVRARVCVCARAHACACVCVPYNMAASFSIVWRSWCGAAHPYVAQILSSKDCLPCLLLMGCSHTSSGRPTYRTKLRPVGASW